jgi:signal transduction histidine kinase
MANQTLKFNVSSGLKSILGNQLITNEEVAIFELIKNSFDADATQIELYFGKDRIVISDNGKGMTFQEIKEKWLFVAYSEKKEANENPNFRDEISKRKFYAGSKGIGRFSADRLGKSIQLQTRSLNEPNSPVNQIKVDWDAFDKNQSKLFGDIEIQYKTTLKFENPDELHLFPHGTIISINKTRVTWTREKILSLKKSLAKLINPFGAELDNFKITMIVPDELEADYKQRASTGYSDDDELNKIINGEIKNFIFSTLSEKTTHINVAINPDNSIETTLIDRGELIYKIREQNTYKNIAKSEFSCQIYYLNTSAKATFTRRMGAEPIKFGSIFLFRNGFRVYPIGEEADDWFGLDRRKQQGYARFLGTRELIGRITITGEEKDFRESTSRDSGLIMTPAVQELQKFFLEKCLKRLEQYVVSVTFKTPEDKFFSDISQLTNDVGRNKVIGLVSKLVGKNDIDLLDFSKNLVQILNEKASSFENSLIGIRRIAEKTKDSDLFTSVEEAEKRFADLKKSEQKAREDARKEQEARKVAEEKAKEAEAAETKAKTQLAEELKRNLFLTAITDLDIETVVNLHHQITLYAVDINTQIENFILDSMPKNSNEKKSILDFFEQISLLNNKILVISKFATKANFRLNSEEIEEDLSNYIESYIAEVVKKISGKKIEIIVKRDENKFFVKFKPIEISIIIDNFISNSKKSGARKIEFDIKVVSNREFFLTISDDGKGFSMETSELGRVFEKGFSATDGSGLGLYHVKQVVQGMKGSIDASKPTIGKGATFHMRIPK